MKGSTTAHSIRQRLLNHAQAHRENFDLVLLRYANERLLYRLGRSVYAERFLLKGATLFLLWNQNQPHRPTRDVDLLALRSEGAEQLRDVFRSLCAVEEADGLVYDADSVTVAPIREERRYGGQRVTLRAELHGARISLQIDIGFGDAVTPAAEWAEVPVVLEGLDKPRLKAYPVYTVIAEKFEAMVQLGMANSRMKDFYDLDFLLSRFSLDNEILRTAIRNTFARRQTALPVQGAVLFSPEFMKEKRRYWEQFLLRNGMELPERSWEELLAGLEARLGALHE
ncbi:MAG: nucleotidyl transferase AbiEii/AbiGii toxin family protein [Brevundimonas sp.]|nr:nucleotidyl transferase AbiEii/AbiGii toxin family protein [Acidobacteriaceae bacterium]MCA3719203.1 nucleotidyl transferase AbiEii/AbiGii toxin family protein [Brevundimonas sp.]